MQLFKITTVAVAALTALIPGLTACDDDSNIGQSVIDESINIVIDSNFSLVGHTVPTDSVQSRTLTQLIGRISVEGFGTLQSDFACQFMPTTAMATNGILSIDSIKLFMRVPKGDYYGDSIAPMGLNVYRLDKDLPYPIYNNTPLEGYYNSSSPIGSAIYSMADFNDTTASASYRQIGVKLDQSIGQYLYDSYLKNPAIFSSPEEFSKDIFKGVAVTNSFGSGRLSRIGQTLMSLYFTRQYTIEDTNRDTIVQAVGDYFAVTPEVVTNNYLRYTPSKAVSDMVAAGDALVVAPAGYEIEMRFPAPEIITRYQNDKSQLSMINSLSLSLPVELIDETGTVTPPANLLLILTSKKKQFFADNLLPDNQTSFYTEYNSTTKRYNFTGLQTYINYLIEKGDLTPEDYTFSLVPVTVTSTTSGSGYYQTVVVSTVTPEATTMSGAKILLDKAKIIFTYSKNTAIY